MGSDEPFSTTASIQRRKHAAHSRPQNEELYWFLGRSRRRTFLPIQVVRTLTEHLAAHNIHRRPPEATAPFLHDSKGFHNTNIRSDTTSEATSLQPYMATSEIWTKGRVSKTDARRTLDSFEVVSFHEDRAAAGIHASSPEGDGPGLCIIILAGGRSGGHQAAVMCAVCHPDS